MIADMINKRNLNSIVTQLSIRERNLNIPLVFITQSYLKVPKDVRLNTTHFFIAKIPNKRELRQIATNHSSDIFLRDFINIFKEHTGKSYSFFVIDDTLASDYPLRLRKFIFDIITIITINDQIKDKKLQYDVNREADKISALSLGKIHKNINTLPLKIYYLLISKK